MVNNLNHAIDLTIEKKLNESFELEKNLKNLATYSKANSLQRRKFGSFKSNFDNFEFDNTPVSKDTYNNQVHTYLRVKKTQCRFNLIGLFKPGELLNTVMNN